MLPDSHVAVSRRWHPIPTEGAHFSHVLLELRIGAWFPVARDAGIIDWKDANRKRIFFARMYCLGNVETKSTKHANRITFVFHFRSIYPNGGAVIDAVEMQKDELVCLR